MNYTPTVREMLRTIRSHKGKVEVPVLAPHDVIHLFAEKGDVMRSVKDYQGGDLNSPSPWYAVGVTNGILRLDTVN